VRNIIIKVAAELTFLWGKFLLIEDIHLRFGGLADLFIDLLTS
jgi:hypothetical protein